MEYWNKVKRTAKNILRPLIYKRKIHGYCIGLPKSGTHSMAAVFRRNYRSQHEPAKFVLLKKIIEIDEKKLSCDEIKTFVRKREKILCLDFNSSAFNIYLADVLVAEFPASKFVLTIRDCYSWLDSCYNHLLSTNFEKNHYKHFPAFINWMFETEKYEYKDEEKEVLGRATKQIDYRLPSTECLLKYWNSMNKKMIEAIPKNRLLIVKTNEIKSNLKHIAKFFTIPIESLDHTKTHQYKAHQNYNIVSKMSYNFVEMQANRYCRDLMDEFFPGTIYSAQRFTN